MKFRFAVTAAATVALAACGSADDASTEAQADTVEVTADEALEGVEEMPVEDAGVSAEAAAAEAEEMSATEEAQIQAAGDNAADTAPHRLADRSDRIKTTPAG